MKSILLGLAALAIFITSCQKNDVTERLNYDDGSINFGVHAAKTLKAEEMTNNYLKGVATSIATGIPLYAYVGAMNEEKKEYFTDDLTWDATNLKWKTQIPHFLPDDGSVLQFFTYYPTTNITGLDYTDDGAGNYAANTYPTFDYTIQPVATQEDLVATMIKDNSNKSVVFQFQHILSQVNFGVKGYYGAQITISNIKVNNVHNSATFDYASFATPAPLSCWTSRDGNVTYDYPFGNGDTFTTPGKGAIGNEDQEDNYLYILGDGGNWSCKNTSAPTSVYYVLKDGSTVVSGSTTGATNPTNSLMLMPQDFVNDTYTTTPIVTFDYSVKDLDGNEVIATTQGKFELKAAGIKDWKPNLRYIYIIDFNLNNNLLTFDVDVEALPWENYDYGGTSGNGTGIVDLKSLGDIFTTSVKNLAVDATYTLPGTPDYQLFNNITWDWSKYKMTNTFAKGDKFYVELGTNVKFNGHTLTIKAPAGFNVTTPTNTTPDTEVILTVGEKVTFEKQ